jgi:hypothetical protein
MQMMALRKPSGSKDKTGTPVKREFFITGEDQITYIYKKQGLEYQEVVNVSYEIKVKNAWMTIVRYDSSHGFLHRHIRISLDNPNEITGGEIEQGGHHAWLTIAITQLLENFLAYRREFFQRSALIDKDP